MKRIVMKFGGSLVGARGGIKRAADLVIESQKRGTGVVVVVSALGDVTDHLLRSAEKAVGWDEARIDAAVNDLASIHDESIRGTSLGESDKEPLISQTHATLEKLRQTLLGVSILGELSPRSKDLVLSFGERMSAPILAAEIQARGHASLALTGGDAGIVTDGTFGEAVPIVPLTNRGVRRSLLPRLARGEIPVVSGFIARDVRGETTTLGRGGSDYTATLLGAALDADEVWIWTDVDGILTADPRVVRNPSSVSRLSYAEAEELAFFGAKNMHPLALGPARTRHIPVRIKNGLKPKREGTLITDEVTKARGTLKVVALVRNVGLLTVAGETLQGKPGIAAKVFTALALAKVNILMISQSVSESSIGMIVRRSSLHAAEAAVRHVLKAEGTGANVDLDPGISVVAAVGAGMKGEKGVAAKVFGAVARRGINVKMIAQGSSELNISFVVDEGDTDEAVRALHGLVEQAGKGGRSA